MSLQDLTPEQIKKLQDAFQKHLEEETKKSIAQFDKTLDSVVDKLSVEGWTLPAELGIYAVNVIGQTDEIDDIRVCFQKHKSERKLKEYAVSLIKPKGKQGVTVEYNR